jgi:hypothetical protein
VHSYSGALPSMVHTSCSSETTLRCPSCPSCCSPLFTRCSSCQVKGCSAGSTSAKQSALAPAGTAAFSFATSSSMLYPIAAACAAIAACTAAAASAGDLGFCIASRSAAGCPVLVMKPLLPCFDHSLAFLPAALPGLAARRE